MPTIVISGPAQAFAGNPRSSKAIKDPRALMRFHGLASDEECAEYLDEPLSEIGLSGGRLRFVFENNSKTLRITTAYLTPRALSEKETQLLVEATRTQWSDGGGSGSFQNFHGDVLSTALAMALQNSGQGEDLGDYFVDAFPMFTNEEPHVEFLGDDAEKTDFDYLEEAAAMGEPQAQFQLGRHLEEGEGIEKDDARAFENYQKAADQGHAAAMTFLGLCFQRGVGTAQDLSRGFACFVEAAGKGESLAMHCVGECYMEGRGVEADPGKGIEWYRRGVELDDMGCMAQLGDCFENGLGVEKDLRQALELYERCMEGGFDAVEPAIKRVKKLLKKSEN